MRSLPNTLPWKVLAKLCRIFEESVESESLRSVLNQFVEAIRSRDVSAYIAICKSSASLRSINRSSGCTLRDIRMIRLLTCFIKYQGFILDTDKLESEAFENFRKAEDSCENFNSTGYFSGNWNSRHALLDSPVRYMKEFISAVCGRFTTSIFKGYLNGPGASVGCRGLRACEIFKALPPFTVNRSCASFGGFLLQSDLYSASSNAESFSHGSFPSRFFSYNEHAHLEFVKKDATALRTITIGNTVNVSLQLALSEHLRKRFKKIFGVNLYTQEHNQLLANYGSLDGSFATIDLKSASDTLALGLLNLFPLSWAEVIFRVREHSWKHKRFGCQPFAKISAMGNGLTSTLQSIIYASIIYAVFRMNNFPWTADIIAVHGDDIVVPDFMFFDVCFLLKEFGMKINVEKTFFKGKVRESCGHDYFSGDRIDRFTVKEKVEKAVDIIKLHNSFKEWGDRFDIDLSPVLTYLLGYLEKKELCYGPNLPNITYEWIRTCDPPGRPFYHKDYQRFFYRIKRYKIERPSSAPKRSLSYSVNTPLVGNISFPCGRVSIFGDKFEYMSHFLSRTSLFKAFMSHLDSGIGYSTEQYDNKLSSSDIVSDCLQLKEAVVVKKTFSLIPFEQWRDNH